MRLASLLSAAAIVVTLSGPSYAIEYITGHITQLEATYMPSKISLQMDVGNSACPVGKWLIWTTGAANTASQEAVYTTMLSALLSGNKVDFIINNNDINCVGQFFHIYSSP
jgi:hypothetical protein